MKLLVDLDYEAFSLNYTLSYEPEKLTATQVTERLQKIEGLTQAYFKAAQIDFNAHPESIQLQGLQDGSAVTVDYQVYAIYGSKRGDSISRRIFALQSNPRHSGALPLFFFDILYTVRNPGIRGTYSPSTKIIGVGPHLLIEEVVGSSATLIHEGTHLNEHMKVLRGEMSLARILLENPELESNEGYRKFLALDEVEAFLRNLRLYRMYEKDPEIQNRRFARTQMGPGMKEIFLKSQRERYAEYKEKITDFIWKGREALNVLEERIQKWDRILVDSSDDNQRVELVVHDTSGSYKTLRIDLIGIATKEDFRNTSKVKESALASIRWSLQRLKNIEAELVVQVP